MENKVYTAFKMPPQVVTMNEEPEKGAIQEFGNECNINSIMDKVQKRKAVPINNAQALFGDFTGINDFHAANNKLIEIENEFMTIDPKVRKRFHNDPAQFLDFVMNAENKAEAIELGIIPKPELENDVKAQSPS